METLKEVRANNNFRQWKIVVLQVFALIAIWFISNQLSILFHLPFSGGIIGLFLLVACLVFGLVKPSSIEIGGDFILANMLLYFIPLVVSLVQYGALFSQSGVRLIAAIGIGFMLVLSATALTVELVCRLIRKKHLNRIVGHRARRNVNVETIRSEGTRI